MLVDLVSVQTQDGVRLDGIFRKPAQEPASQLGVDVVILHHGVGGNFYHPGMFDAFSDALLDMGCAVLRVNNRGHDLVSRVMVSQVGHEPEAKRLGAAYEDMDACRHDWAAWVDFARANHLGEFVQRDILACLRIIKFAVRVPFDHICHMRSLHPVLPPGLCRGRRATGAVIDALLVG